MIADLRAASARRGTTKTGCSHELDKLFSLEAALHLFGAAARAYALVEGVEAVGLWYAGRWAEYLTLIVTASFLPLEVYELAHTLSPSRSSRLIVNVAVVAYLLFAKRLFGIRGGAAADEARASATSAGRRSERATPTMAPPTPVAT